MSESSTEGNVNLDQLLAEDRELVQRDLRAVCDNLAHCLVYLFAQVNFFSFFKTCAGKLFVLEIIFVFWLVYLYFLFTWRVTRFTPGAVLYFVSQNSFLISVGGRVVYFSWYVYSCKRMLERNV